MCLDPQKKPDFERIDSMKKAIIFDMDGLMFDSERVTWELYKKICLEYGYKMTYQYYLSLVGSPMTVVRKMLTRHFGEDFPREKIIHQVHDEMDLIFSTEGVPVKKGLREILKYAKNANLKTLVATSSDRNRVDRILVYAGVREFISGLVCGDEVTNGKPAPDIFLKGTELLGIKPEEAFVLEDSEFGILAAHRANIDVICVPDLKQPGNEYKKLTLAVADTLLEAKDIIKEIVEK